MTHIVRNVDKQGSKLDKKDVVEAVTILECPPMIAIGMVGYIETPRGQRALATVFAQHISDEARRRFNKNSWEGEGQCVAEQNMDRIKKYCQTVRIICHTQISKVRVGQKKAHIKEIQINGGDIAKKVDFAR